MDHTGSVDAGKLARVHLKEYAGESLNIFQYLHTPADAVDTDIFVIFRKVRKGLDDPPVDGKVFGAVALFSRRLWQIYDNNSLFQEKLLQLFERQNCVDDTALIGLALFGNTGAEKDNLNLLPKFPAQYLRMSYHGRIDHGKVLERLRIVHLNQPDNRRTGRGNQILIFTRFQLLAVLIDHCVCAACSFLGKNKSRLKQRLLEALKVLEFEI